MRPGFLTDFATGLLIAGVVMLFLAGFFEVYLWQRWENEQIRLLERHGDRSLCTRPAQDKRLLYEFVPGQCGANSQGFIDAEREYAKLPGVYRIVLIGDSVAQGHGVDLEARFGNVLARRLGPGVEIVNLARTGYSTSQQLLLLDQVVWRYDADLLLWSYVLNDPAHPVYHDANGELGRFYHRPIWRGYAYFTRKLFEARERWLARNCEPTYHELLHCVYREDIARDLAYLGYSAATLNVPVLFVIHPLLIDGLPYPHKIVHADLTQLARAAGMEVVDLQSILSETEPRRLRQNLTTWLDPWHPNEEGHRRIADHLVSPVNAIRGG